MHAPPRGIPLRPDHASLNEHAVGALVRSVITAAHAKLNPTARPGEFARAKWGDDRGLDWLTRAVSSPAMTTVPGWAQELAAVSTRFIESLVPASAGADLLGRGMQLNMAGVATILLPAISFASSKATFVGQGQPIPARQFQTSSGAKLEPHKLATITSLTREMIEGSNAETIVRAALSESVAAGLDAVLFSANAATPDAPAGLLNGLTALTPSTSADKIMAMIDDLAALAGSVARVASNSETVFIAAPEQAVSLKVRTPKDLEYDVLASAALPPGTVIALAVAALASAFEGTPQIEASREAEIHFEDGAPAEIVSGSGIVARPVRSIYQTDSIALRLVMPASWTLRAPSAIAYMSAVSW